MYMGCTSLFFPWTSQDTSCSEMSPYSIYTVHRLLTVHLILISSSMPSPLMSTLKKNTAGSKVNKVFFHPTQCSHTHTLTHTQSVTHVQVSHGASLKGCAFLWICSNRIYELEGLDGGQARRLDFGS